MRALYFGTYDRAHPRNVNAIAALRGAGIEVAERRATVHGTGPVGSLGVLLAELRLTGARRRGADVVIVGYPGHFDMPSARRLAGRAPLIFDALLSLEDELVTTRRRYRRRSLTATLLRTVDRRALEAADLVVCATEAAAAYLEELGARRTAAVFLGADEETFDETWAPVYPFGALHLTDTSTDIVREAAELLPDLPVRIAEPGTFARDELGLAFAHAGIVLAGLRATRSISAAVFDALVTGTPVITADTAATRELLVDGESALLVTPDDAPALAAAIRRLADDIPLRERIAAGGRAVFAARASRAALGARWRELLEGLL